MEDAVVVKRVSGEFEADLVCGLLRSAGIECGSRVTDEIDSAFDNFLEAGPHEVIVHPQDLEAARQLLAESERGDDFFEDEEAPA
jgi:hypothetical protein